MTKEQKLLPWLVWGLGAFFVMYQFLLQTSVSVMIPDLKQAFHINATGIGLLSSSFFYTYLIMQIPSGILIDRLGPRKILVVSVFVTALACFLFAWSHVLSEAEASRMLMGFVTAPSVVCAFALAARWFKPKDFALLVGLTEMLGVSGGAVGEVFLSRIISGPLGWRATLVICGVIGLILTALVCIFVYDRPGLKKKTVKSLDDKNLWPHILRTLSSVQLWLLGLYSGLMFSVINGFASLWAIPFLMHFYQMTLEKAATASALVFLGGGLGSPIWGWVSCRIGRRRVPMFIGAIAAMTCGFILFYVALPVWQLFLLLFLFGLFSATYVLSFATASDRVRLKVKGTALGFINMMCILVGAPILQPIMGYVLNSTHNNYQKAFMPLLVCLGLAFLLVFFIKETRCRPIHHEEQ